QGMGGADVSGQVGRHLPGWSGGAYEVPHEEGPPEPAEVVERGANGSAHAAEGAAPEETAEEGVVVYRPGMTMDDLEREAITAALAEVNGNRRKAAERLGIGERTLYRKI